MAYEGAASTTADERRLDEDRHLRRVRRRQDDVRGRRLRDHAAAHRGAGDQLRPTGVDGLEATPNKTTTTVAMDFGRITLAEDLVLYLFGTPGQRRFWFMWDDLVRGAIGAIILVDVRRLQDSFAAVDFFEARNLPFLIAINEFDGAPRHPAHAVRKALALPDHIPVITVDARDRHSRQAALIAVTEYALNSLTSLPG